MPGSYRANSGAMTGSKYQMENGKCSFMGYRWYGTGSGSDLVDSEVVGYKAPGRYRSLYRTNSPAVSHSGQKIGITNRVTAMTQTVRIPPTRT